MNHFSDKEYQILKSDTAEVRSAINRYIGYIITVTGFSGFIKFYFDAEIGASGTLTMFFVSLLVLTLLFEIIWYKFKSHNRMVGYMQLMMQEMDAIPYEIINGNEGWKNKDYIEHWKSYTREPGDKGLEHCFSWEFIMSRFNSNLFNKNKDYKSERKTFTDALDKSNYIFSLTSELTPYTKTWIRRDDQGNKIYTDVDFFSNIIFPIHKKDNSISIWKWPWFKYINFLYFNKKKDVRLDDITVEKTYLIYGWGYPRKITQIAFMAVCLTFAFFVYYILNNYQCEYEFQFNPAINLIDNVLKLFKDLIPSSLDVLLPFILFVGSGLIVRFWFFRYVKGLKDLVYGRFSIDYYCWDFFIYRVQMLNNKSLVPVYYSRAFIRYFKSRLYLEVLEFRDNENRILSIIGEDNSEHLNTYKEALRAHKEFPESSISKNLHCSLVKSFKAMKKTGKPTQKSIPKTILKKFFKPI